MDTNRLPEEDGPVAETGKGVVSLETYHAARERVLTRFEIRYLRLLLDASSSNLNQASRLAGVDRTTLYRLLEKHGFTRALSGHWAEPQKVAA